jgi:hypothetical protein
MVAIGGTLELLPFRTLLSGLAISSQGSTMQHVWAIPTGLTWLFILGYAVAAWIAGFGTGYRNGARDAIKDKILKAAPALDSE